MKILMVVHQFLPRCLAGTELYTYHLACELRRLGHDVRLYFTEIDNGSPQYTLRRREYDGLPCFEAVHNHYFPTFEHTYRDREMEKNLRHVLDATAPDLVHIQHLLLHSIGYVDLIKERGLPIVWTLHEYILLCLRDGLLLRHDETPCTGPEPEACATCATAPPFGSKPLRAASVLGTAAQSAARFPALLGPARALWRRGRAIRDLVMNGNGYVSAVQERRTEIQRRLDQVDVFLAPSRFLREKFIETGAIPPERIEFSPNGMRKMELRPRTNPGASLRVGFIGTISRPKGVHLILDALRDVPGDGIECFIYGDLGVAPEYVAELRKGGTPHQVRYPGRLERGEVPATLAALDVLVVPSIWYENAPLTIQEAFIAGVPVVASDQSAMVELVEHGKNGLLFRCGDSADLRRQLVRLRDDPQLLRSLRPDAEKVRDIRDDATVMESRYARLLPQPAHACS